MDVSAVTALVKELSQANSDGNTEDVMRILGKLKAEVTPTEDVLRASKAGVAVGKLRTHATPGVSSLAKEVVKLWKDAVEESKKRRKRDDGDEKDSAAKRVKREDNSSNGTPAGGSPATAASPDVQPKSETRDEVKPKTEKTDSKDIVKTEASSSATTPTKRPALSTIDSSRTVPRTAKSDGSKINARDNDGEDVRDKCAVMIYDALAGDSTAEKKILVERAMSIEWAAFQLLKASTGNDYRAKMRSLFLNLKDKGNPALRNEIVLGYISADKVVNMTKEEMASESVRALNEKIASDNLFKAKAVGETQAETDAFKCGRCQQRKCTYYQMQTRSADEPMTTFVSCTNCGNRWKFS